MEHIKLKSAFRRSLERKPSEYRYKSRSIIYLKKPEMIHQCDFFHVLESRKSRRDGDLISEDDIAHLLYYCARVKHTEIEDSGFLWQHRPVPSAGGRHPIDIILFNYRGDDSNIYLYEPFSHSLACLEDINNASLNRFIALVNDVLKVGNATILWFVGQFDRTMSKYLDSECLVWLDAGILMGTVYLVAEALSLKCCAVGITGDPWITEALKGDGLIDGLTGCLVWK